jgi:hypothetical protein
MVSLTKTQAKLAMMSYLNTPFTFDNLRDTSFPLSVEAITSAQHDPLRRFVYHVEFDRNSNQNLLMAKVGTSEWTDKFLGLKTKATLAQTKYEAYLENLDSATFQAHDVDIQDAIRKRGEHLGPQATSTWTQLQPLLTDAEFLRMQLSPLSNILLSDPTAADKLRRFSAEGNFFGSAASRFTPSTHL